MNHAPENFQVGYIGHRKTSDEGEKTVPYDIEKSSSGLPGGRGELVILPRHVTPMSILKVKRQSTPVVGGDEMVPEVIPHQEGIRYKAMGNDGAGSTFVAAVTATLSQTDIFQSLFVGAQSGLSFVGKYSQMMGLPAEAPVQVGMLIGITLLATQVFRETKETVYTFFNVSTGLELINITYYNTKTSISVASSFITGVEGPVAGIKRTADYMTYTLGASALLLGGGVLYSASSSKRKKNKLDEYGPPALLLVGGTALILTKNVI